MLRRLWQGREQRDACGEMADGFQMGRAPHGISAGLLVVVDGPVDLLTTVKVHGQLGRNVAGVVAIGYLECPTNPAVQLEAPSGGHTGIQHLLVERMQKTVAGCGCSIWPYHSAVFLQQLLASG